MSRNIVYNSDQIAHFYGEHRGKWDEFYPSERWIFERVLQANNGFGSVFDVGCAAGGLGLALAEKDNLSSYTGIDINPQVIAIAKTRTQSQLRAPSQFYEGDVLTCDALNGQTFDLVASLSVADWNVDTKGIIDRCWSHVAPGGYFVISLRLTPGESSFSMDKSFQYVSFDSTIPDHAERAPYVVFNVREALSMLGGLSPRPGFLLGYGYWGKPSVSARTPHDRLIFAVFAARKDIGEGGDDPFSELHLPLAAYGNS